MPSLIAHINNTKIGHLTKTTDGSMQFCYDDNWLDEPNAYPISLSLPLQSQPHIGDPVANYFDNLLPDLTSTRQNIQRRHSTDSTDVFDLLHAIGHDCVGSLSLLPANEIHNGRASTRLEPLSVRNLHDIVTAHEYQFPLACPISTTSASQYLGRKRKLRFLKSKMIGFYPVWITQALTFSNFRSALFSSQRQHLI